MVGKDLHHAFITRIMGAKITGPQDRVSSMIPDGIAPIENGIFHIRIVVEFHVKLFILKVRRTLHFQQIYGRSSRVNTEIPDSIILGISHMTELECWQRITAAPIAEKSLPHVQCFYQALQKSIALIIDVRRCHDNPVDFDIDTKSYRRTFIWRNGRIHHVSTSTK